MKHILLIIVGILILTTTAKAQETRAQASASLMGLGMPAELATQVAGLATGLGVVSNATWLKGRNAAGSANINIVSVDSSDNTVINSSASDELILQLEDDAQRLVRFTAASDTAIAMKYGDGGATAVQDFYLLSNTADADDDSSFYLGAGGVANNSRGAYVQMFGNETGSAGAMVIGAGASATIALQTGAATKWTVNTAGEFIGAGTAAIGWAVVDGADNTACTTQCVTPAVFGFNLSAGATAPVIVGPSDATADICLCAGAT